MKYLNGSKLIYDNSPFWELKPFISHFTVCIVIVENME